MYRLLLILTAIPFFFEQCEPPGGPGTPEDAGAQEDDAGIPGDVQELEYVCRPDAYQERFEFQTGDIIAIRASNHRFLSRIKEQRYQNYQDLIVAQSKFVDTQKRFEVIVHGVDRISLKADNGLYLGRFRIPPAPPASDLISAMYDSIEEASIFEVIYYNNGQIALKADNGHYLQHDYNYDLTVEEYVIVAEKDEVDDRSRFCVLPNPKDTSLECPMGSYEQPFEFNHLDSFALWASNGLYIGRTGEKKLEAKNDFHNEYSVFTVHEYDREENKFYIRTDNLRYFRWLTYDSKTYPVEALEFIGGDPYFVFEVVYHEDGQISLKTNDDHYVAVNRNNAKNPIERMSTQYQIDARFCVIPNPKPCPPLSHESEFEFEDGERIALWASNNRYLSRINRGDRNPIEAAKKYPDEASVFTVEVDDETGQIALKADNDKYLRWLTYGSDNPPRVVEAIVDEVDIHSQFDVLYWDDGRVSLKTDDDHYFRWLLRDGKYPIETPHTVLDEFTQFCVIPLQYKLERWMEDLDDTIGDKSLNEIAIPGTHDTGTYGTNGDSEFTSEEGAWVDFWRQLGKPVAIAFTKTQKESIRLQLEQGNRYFDIRPYRGRDGRLYTFHGQLAGTGFHSLLTEVRNFLQTNKKEIIILDVRRFGNIETSGEHLSVARYIIATFGEGGSSPDPVPPGQYRLIPSEGEHPQTITPNEIWSKSWRRVIVRWAVPEGSKEGEHDIVDFLNDELEDQTGIANLIWKGPVIGSREEKKTQPWFDTLDLDYFVEEMEWSISEEPHPYSPEFYMLQGVLTPPKDKDWYVAHVASSLEEECAQKINPKLTELIREKWWRYDLNIVTADFYDTALTYSVIDLNLL